MKLSYEQRKELYENGYVVISGAIPKAMVNEIKKSINHSLGEEGMNKEDIPKFRSLSFCPEIQRSSLMTDVVYKTTVYNFIDSVLDMEKIYPLKSAQVALRFPTYHDPVPVAIPHVDGMLGANNIPGRSVENSTALIGIFLSDVTENNAGNFNVWPGSHRIYEQYIREHGPEVFLDGLPPVDMPGPVQIKAKAGDVILCHWQLAHGAGANISPDPRFALFYRLKHVEVDDDYVKPLKNIWMHYRESMQEFEK